ncbi:MAG: S1C family serine protease [Promicromonosporaceae bacterium]|nr:S1C family serine protease [Promicromonosporaceae bacterium]
MKQITTKQAGFVAGGLTLTLVLGAGGYAVVQGRSAPEPSTTSASGFDPWWWSQRDRSGQSGQSDQSGASGQQQAQLPPWLQGSQSTQQQTPSTQPTADATATQERGVVVIETVLGYEGAQAAGTGVVLTSDGEVLTNNHVVEGSTQIKVTVAATGATYTATVVGTDATDDVAVLKLQGAHGLETAPLSDGTTPTVGSAVTAVGDAGGTGTLTAATGTVTALDQTITTQSELATVGESLHGLIEVSADVIPGDSGGPLLDAAGRVVGIDTAASSGSVDVTGYAIPLTTALTIAGSIESGTASSTVTIGYPAFLGVQIASQYTGVGGAVVAGAIDGTPAQAAGITAGSTITAVDGTPVTSASGLTAALAGHKPGDRVSITWDDASGQQHSATVTLAQGPAA